MSKHGGRRTGAGRKPKVDGVAEFLVEDHSDERGRLRVLDNLPFAVKRAFVLDRIPATQRAGHAHRTCHQLIFCASGSFQAETEQRRPYSSFVRKTLKQGDAMVIPAMHWLTLDKFSKPAICLVLASEPFNEAEMIRDWDEFLKLTGE